jgi:hypothetical protein
MVRVYSKVLGSYFHVAVGVRRYNIPVDLIMKVLRSSLQVVVTIIKAF